MQQLLQHPVQPYPHDQTGIPGFMFKRRVVILAESVKTFPHHHGIVSSIMLLENVAESFE
jgi:hypothetical protein